MPNLRVAKEVMRIPADVDTMRDESNCPVCGSEYDGMLCDSCGFESPPEDLKNPDTEKKGRDPQYQTQPEGSGPPAPEDAENEGQAQGDPEQDQEEAEAENASDLGAVENDPSTKINELQQELLKLKDLQRMQQLDAVTQQRQGANMSRFDKELRPSKRQAMVPGVQYDQVSNMNLDGPFGLSSVSPPPQPSQWKDVMPARELNVQDLDAPDVMGGPGDNRVVAEPDVYPEEQPIGERAASKFIRAAAKGLAENENSEAVDKALWSAHNALKEAAKNDRKVYAIDRRLGIIFKHLKEGKSVKIDNVIDRLKEVHDQLEKKTATNGNQETSRPTLVQDLDDITESREEVMTPDAVTDVQVPNLQPNQLQLADVPPYYNDGASTGFVPQESENKNPWPSDGTNPALNPYPRAAKKNKKEKGKEKKSVCEKCNEGELDSSSPECKACRTKEASREGLFQAVNLVDRLEKLGMVRRDERAKHIAQYEKMSPSKIEGVIMTLDTMERTGAVKQRQAMRVSNAQPNRVPEMGRATKTASVSKQDTLNDDYLITL
jgi:hypothetical protein